MTVCTIAKSNTKHFENSLNPNLFEIYPNPALTSVIILSDYSPISTNLYDSQGKQVMSFGKEKSFYISHLQSGIY